MKNRIEIAVPEWTDEQAQLYRLKQQLASKTLTFHEEKRVKKQIEA